MLFLILMKFLKLEKMKPTNFMQKFRKILLKKTKKMCNDKLLQDYFGINNFTIIMLQNG